MITEVLSHFLSTLPQPTRNEKKKTQRKKLRDTSCDDIRNRNKYKSLFFNTTYP